MREFKKWWIKEAPYTDESSAEAGWRAALMWIENELDKVQAGGGFEPDLGLRNLLKKELNGKT